MDMIHIKLLVYFKSKLETVVEISPIGVLNYLHKVLTSEFKTVYCVLYGDVFSVFISITSLVTFPTRIKQS